MPRRRYPWFLALILACIVGGGQASDVAAVLPQVEMCIVGTPPQDCDTIVPTHVELGPGEAVQVEVILQVNNETCHVVTPGSQATPCPTEATLSIQDDLPLGIIACIPVWTPNEPQFACLPLPQVIPLPTSVTLVLGTVAEDPTSPNTYVVQPGIADLTVCADFTNGTEAGGVCDSLTLAVHPFALVPSINTVTLKPGESTTIPVAVTRTAGFLDAIALQEILSILDKGISLLYDPNPVTSTDLTTDLHLGVGAAADQGTYTVKVTGTGGGVTRSTPITVQVKRCHKIGLLEICK